MSAIEASTVRIATMADSTLRLTLDIEPRFAQAAFQLFGLAGTPVALAALQVAKSEPEPEYPKGGELARWCAIRCQESEFQLWLSIEFGLASRAFSGLGISLDVRAANIIRSVLGIESRAEIDNSPQVRAEFDRLIRVPYSKRLA